MIKKWSKIIALVLALTVIALSAVPVLGQSQEENGNVSTPPEGGQLAADGPAWASPGETVTITVYQRGTEDPVKDAGVWALTRENAEAFKAEIETIKAQSDNTTEIPGLESIVGIYGFFIGTTNGAGKVTYTFEEEGFYLLIAVKEGYIPGRTGIAIKTPPVALAIEAPKRALPGETVTMTVFQRGNEDPVKDAGVWALTRENAESLKADIEAIRAQSDNATDLPNLESLVSIYGFFIGTTNGAGKVMYAFEEEGFYLLIAVKEGYIPGRTGIAIKTPPAALRIEVDRQNGNGNNQQPQIQQPQVQQQSQRQWQKQQAPQPQQQGYRQWQKPQLKQL